MNPIKEPSGDHPGFQPGPTTVPTPDPTSKTSTMFGAVLTARRCESDAHETSGDTTSLSIRRGFEPSASLTTRPPPKERSLQNASLLPSGDGNGPESACRLRLTSV